MDELHAGSLATYVVMYGSTLVLYWKASLWPCGPPPMNGHQPCDGTDRALGYGYFDGGMHNACVNGWVLQHSMQQRDVHICVFVVMCLICIYMLECRV